MLTTETYYLKYTFDNFLRVAKALLPIIEHYAAV